MDALAPARHHLHARCRVPHRPSLRTGKRPSAQGDGLLTPPRLIRPSITEIRRVLARTFIAATHDIGHILTWSLFRLTHQTRALVSHYRSRGDPPPQDLRM